MDVMQCGIVTKWLSLTNPREISAYIWNHVDDWIAAMIYLLKTHSRLNGGDRGGLQASNNHDNAFWIENRTIIARVRIMYLLCDWLTSDYDSDKHLFYNMCCSLYQCYAIC